MIKTSRIILFKTITVRKAREKAFYRNVIWFCWRQMSQRLSQRGWRNTDCEQPAKYISNFLTVIRLAIFYLPSPPPHLFICIQGNNKPEMWGYRNNMIGGVDFTLAMKYNCSMKGNVRRMKARLISAAVCMRLPNTSAAADSASRRG